MNSLIISAGGTLLFGVVVNLIMGGSFGDHFHFDIVQVVFILLAVWWRHDIVKWVDAKKASESGGAPAP